MGLQMASPLQMPTPDIHAHAQLIAKAIQENRDQYIIATKFGWEIDEN